MPAYQPTSYSQAEERFNVVSHALGFAGSVIGTGLLISVATTDKAMISALIYGLSMMILYASSTLYHAAKDAKLRKRLNIFDHAAIYVLIAGTYTPFSLITLQGTVGNTLLTAVWLFALAGVVLKLFFTGRFDRLSTLMYIFMGWMVVFAIKPFMDHLPVEGLYWLLAGGISYTVGAILYSLDGKLHFNHALFHVLVLVGSACHFFSVYYYVLT